MSQSELAVLHVMYSSVCPQFSTGLECGDIQLPSSFQKLNFVSIEGQKFESGPKAFYLAKSVFPFVTDSSTTAGVTDSHIQDTQLINVLYYIIQQIIPNSTTPAVVTVLAQVLWS